MFKIRNKYNANGFLYRVENADNPAQFFWQADAANTEDQITQETLGNGLVTNRDYDLATNLIKSISTGTSGQIQNLSYVFDSLGNLDYRIDHNQKLGTQTGVTEGFAYDGLNRLTMVNLNSIQTSSYEYDRLGNITYNSNTGYYTYAQNGAGPHAVTSINSSANVSSNAGVVAGDANADLFINGSDIDKVAGIVLETDTAPANGKPDCTNESTIDVRDAVCIKNKISASGGSFGRNYEYDPNGNMVRGAGRTIKYTAYNKPYSIANGSAQLMFEYGADRNRISQRILNREGMRTIHYIGKLFEKQMQSNGTVEFKYFIYAGSALVAINTRVNNNTENLRFALLDHLGSIDTLTDESGKIVERFSYDAFGKRRTATWNDGPTAEIVATLISSVTSRSFTGHEYLADMGLIHMNGRVYDPEIGRFLSADSYIQFPEDIQGFNRYSYVLNNPLSATDPTGHFLAYLLENISNFMDDWAPTIVQMGITSGLSTLAAPLGVPLGIGYVIGAGFVSGFIFSEGDVKTAIISGITAGAFNIVGDFSLANGLLDGGIEKTLMHGMVGGLSTGLQGGNFVEGFVSATAGEWFSPTIKGVPNGFGRLIVTAVVGGTAAEIGGGKFQNGAITAAFGYLFNHEAHSGEQPSRKQCVLNGGGCNFSVADNPSADSGAPWYEMGSLSQVGEYSLTIEMSAGSLGVDPNLVRSIIYMETTHGCYDVLLSPLVPTNLFCQ